LGFETASKQDGISFGVAESKRERGTIVREEDPTWLRDRF
jgi:hypothetical protein